MTFYPNPRLKGKFIETRVIHYIEKKGFTVIEKNYTCKMGEIDIIAKSPKDEIVFIEVRYRKNEDFGSALESVTYAKQQKIIRTALQYLQKHNLFEKVPCRFDIIGVRKDLLEFHWLENAFEGF